MASVTLPGAAPGSPIVETFGNQANLQLALQIRDALVAASTAGVLTVSTVAGGANVRVPLPPTTLGAGGVNELIINAAGSYTIPAGSAGRPDYVVVIDPATAGNVTIHGASNSTILGGNAHVTIVDPATTWLDATVRLEPDELAPRTLVVHPRVHRRAALLRALVVVAVMELNARAAVEFMALRSDNEFAAPVRHVHHRFDAIHNQV